MVTRLRKVEAGRLGVSSISRGTYRKSRLAYAGLKLMESLLALCGIAGMYEGQSDGLLGKSTGFPSRGPGFDSEDSMVARTINNSRPRSLSLRTPNAYKAQTPTPINTKNQTF